MFIEIYGISQNPDTNDFILVQKNFIWLSGNEKIDDFIQEMLSNNDMIEWIPYNQFNDIKEIGKNNSMAVYSAIWKDGPFYKRDSNKEVVLKCLQNSQYTIELLINEVNIYLNFLIFTVTQYINF
jgi:hypothetical protein